MNIEKMREEFELWVQERSVDTPMGYYPQLLNRCRLDEKLYTTSWVDAAWEGWQASRESLVFHTGELADENTCPLSVESYWIKQIEAAGLKVKS